jgi:LacI family transcriptional regulator
MPRPPTIIDVARTAGVSKSTVSNVLQGKGTVDPDIRVRVSKAIEEIGYQPNAGARSMRQRSKVFGVVVSLPPWGDPFGMLVHARSAFHGWR